MKETLYAKALGRAPNIEFAHYLILIAIINIAFLVLSLFSYVWYIRYIIFVISFIGNLYVIKTTTVELRKKEKKQ